MIRLLCCCLAVLLCSISPAVAAPGLCTGPVCAEGITRSANNHWQLVLKLSDQHGHREKVTMTCKAGMLSPLDVQVDPSYATFLGLIVCRLSGYDT